MTGTLPPASEAVRTAYNASRTIWSTRLRDGIPRALAQRDKTVDEVADMFRVKPATVVRYSRLTARNRRLHDTAVLHGRGVGWTEIAARLDVQVETVRGYVRELALDGQTDPACPHCGR